MRLNIGKGIEWDFDGWFFASKGCRAVTFLAASPLMDC